MLLKNAAIDVWCSIYAYTKAVFYTAFNNNVSLLNSGFDYMLLTLFRAAPG